MVTLDRSERTAVLVGAGALVALVFVQLLGTALSGLLVGETSGMGGMGGMAGMGTVAGVGMLTTLFAGLVGFIALMAFGYAGISLIAAESEKSTSTESAGVTATEAGGSEPESADRVERIKRRYAEGELDEAAFERELERELGDEAVDTEAESAGRVESEVENRPSRERDVSTGGK